jgi:predicted ATPase
MKIRSLKIKNYKRFTDLSIENIPETAKLVLVVGPNGCGKSSIFDALLQWYSIHSGLSYTSDEKYYRKDKSHPFQWGGNVTVELEPGKTPVKGSLYVRTAYRNDADFEVSNITNMTSPIEKTNFYRLIDNDQTVSENYQRLVYETMSAMYNEKNDGRNILEVRNELIGAIQLSMRKVFGDLIMRSIGDPLESGTFLFDKGNVTGFSFKNLSGGEKSAFDLLLDIHIKAKFYKDSIFCIDEMETHLHTKVQGALLKEIFAILPSNAQLWITTHSLGVMRAAQEIDRNQPGAVAVIDFDGVDSDVASVLIPSSLERISWEKMLSIALDDLSERVFPQAIVICEGSSVGNRRKNFDAEIYSRVLGGYASGIVFISGGASSQLLGSGVSVAGTIKDIVSSAKVISLCDLDDKSPREVADFEACNGLVLARRNIESYLLADDVILALAEKSGFSELFDQAIAIKSGLIAESIVRGNAPDDLKSISGSLYVQLKRLFFLQNVGNSAEAFMRDTLAPLLKPPLQSFQDLKESILDRI